MKTSLRFLLPALLMVACLPVLQAEPSTNKSSKTEKPLSPEEAQKEAERQINSIQWVRDSKGKLGSVAEIDVPKGFRFTEKAGSKKMMELFGNIPNDSQLGYIAPENFDWSVIFSYDDVGYVKDTDKDKLDADAILKQLKEGQEEANEEREARGLNKLYLVGWAIPPRYNESTHNLEWAIKVRSETGGVSVNYRTKLLGRRGVTNATLLVSSEELQSTLPQYQKLLTGFGFIQGQTYAEYRQGDKVAQYALTGLITAGAGVALMKSGWLAKLGIVLAKGGKIVYVFVIGVIAGIKKLLMRLFGRNEES